MGVCALQRFAVFRWLPNFFFSPPVNVLFPRAYLRTIAENGNQRSSDKAESEPLRQQKKKHFFPQPISCLCSCLIIIIIIVYFFPFIYQVHLGTNNVADIKRVV